MDKKIEEAIKFLEENGYVVHTKETILAAFSNIRNNKSVITNKKGKIVGLQG